MPIHPFAARTARARVLPFLLLGTSLAACGQLRGCGSPPQQATYTGCPEERLPHDHTPLHGGQVGMVGDYHLEVVDTGEEIRVYVSDECRSPLPPPSGATLVLEPETGPGEPIERPLEPVDGYMRADRAGMEIPFLATVKGRVGPHLTEMTFLIFEPPGGAERPAPDGEEGEGPVSGSVP